MSIEKLTIKYEKGRVGAFTGELKVERLAAQGVAGRGIVRDIEGTLTYPHGQGEDSSPPGRQLSPPNVRHPLNFPTCGVKSPYFSIDQRRDEATRSRAIASRFQALRSRWNGYVRGWRRCCAR